MSVGAGFARDDVFRPNRWLPKSETSYHLNARLGVRKRLVSFYSAGFAAIDPDVLLARRTRRAEWERVHRETVPLALENFVSAVSGHHPLRLSTSGLWRALRTPLRKSERIQWVLVRVS